MRFKPKYIWSVAVVLILAAGFFGIWSPPKDWGAAMSVVASLDTWVIAHSVYPSLVFIGASLLIGTILIPEAWGMLKDHIFPPKMRPDVDGATIFKEIMAKSKRAKALMHPDQLTRPLPPLRYYESHYTDAGVKELRLKVKLADEFHDHLRWGDITAWGTPDGKKPHQEIKPEEWSDIEIDFDEQDMNYDPPHVHAVKRKTQPSGTVFGYVWLRFNRKQVRRVYPFALWARRRPRGPLLRQ